MNTFATIPALIKNASRFHAAVAALRDAQKEGSIPNARFIEHKDAISRAVENAWDAVRHGHGMGAWADQPVSFREWRAAAPLSSGVTQLAKALRKWLMKRPVGNDTKAYADRVIAFMREVEVLGALLDDMKTKAVKRAPGKTEAERQAERFTPPPATTAATIRVRDMLMETVNAQFEALIVSFTQRYESEIARFVEQRDKRLVEIAASDKPTRIYPLSFYLRDARYADGSFLSRVLVTTENYREITPRVRDDAAQIVAEMACKDAEEVRAAFVAKNLRKVVSIIERKEKASPLTVCEAIKQTVLLSGFEGTFRVGFEDGSGFWFTNSVVFKVSVLGTPFHQFPLRFHDVVLAGGVKMPQPSEERMNKVFAA